MKLGSLLEKLALAQQIQDQLKALDDLQVGQSAEVPPIRFRARGKRFVWGPSPVRRE
jgi:hypothetical protein